MASTTKPVQSTKSRWSILPPVTEFFFFKGDAATHSHFEVRGTTDDHKYSFYEDLSNLHHRTEDLGIPVYQWDDEKDTWSPYLCRIKTKPTREYEDTVEYPANLPYYIKFQLRLDVDHVYRVVCRNHSIIVESDSDGSLNIVTDPGFVRESLPPVRNFIFVPKDEKSNDHFQVLGVTDDQSYNLNEILTNVGGRIQELGIQLDKWNKETKEWKIYDSGKKLKASAGYYAMKVYPANQPYEINFSIDINPDDEGHIYKVEYKEYRFVLCCNDNCELAICADPSLG